MAVLGVGDSVDLSLSGPALGSSDPFAPIRGALVVRARAWLNNSGSALERLLL